MKARALALGAAAAVMAAMVGWHAAAPPQPAAPEPALESWQAEIRGLLARGCRFDGFEPTEDGVGHYAVFLCPSSQPQATPTAGRI